MLVVQNPLRHLLWYIYLQGGRDGGVQETVNDRVNLLDQVRVVRVTVVHFLTKGR